MKRSEEGVKMIAKFSLKSNMKNMKDLPLTSTPPRGVSLSFSFILLAGSKKSTLVSFFTSHSLFKHMFWGRGWQAEVLHFCWWTWHVPWNYVVRKGNYVTDPRRKDRGARQMK